MPIDTLLNPIFFNSLIFVSHTLFGLASIVISHVLLIPQAQSILSSRFPTIFGFRRLGVPPPKKNRINFFIL